MINIFVILLIIILVIFYLYKRNFDYFNNNYPFNPKIHTLQSNYIDNINKINYQQKYKKDMSIALNPIPTIQCQLLKDKDNCNKYGCNWFDTYCSAIYPTYL